MNKLLSPVLFFAFVFISTQYGMAQTDPVCLQALRSARASYEQGRLQELEYTLQGCLDKFTKAEKVEAYKLLVLTYIYLEEPEQADKAMLSLLGADHFFEINEGTDPAEFINLYKKFRKDPIFSVGIRGSFLTTNVNVQNHYYIFGSGKGGGTFSSNQKIVVGLAFEKTLIKDKLVLAPEFMFSARSFTYTNNNIFGTDNVTQATSLTAQVSQQLLQLNIIGNYLFKKKLANNFFQPYAGLGLSTSYLISSSFEEAELNVEPGFEDVSGAPLDNTLNYKPLNFSAILLAGVKFKVTELYVTADVRYYWGLNNVVDTENRYSQESDNVEILNRYGYVNNDFSINQAAISIGIIYPYFKPKKLIK